MSALEHALALIQKFEGCRLTAYPDPGTGGDPWTVGWGSTGPDIGPGTVWTQDKADARLAVDVRKFMAGVADAVTVELSPMELGALTSLAYNIGLGAFRKSTLLRKLNAGDRNGAAEQFLRWNRAGSRVMAGLTRRREAERATFLGPDFSNVTGGSDTVPGG